MKSVFIDLKKSVDYSYNIFIGNNFIQEKLFEFDEKTTYFIIDKNVFNLYPFLKNLKNVFIFDASEENKNLLKLTEILEFLRGNNALRDANIVAIGGGIVGDVAGFAAAIYMRGITYYQVPTTLLSMVDSSVGGKTGINFKNVKNLVGAFYQPKSVFIDTMFLNTLTFEEYKNGLAEVIKYALMFDKEFYNLLYNENKNILNRKDVLEEIILRCCEIKGNVVKIDEKENDIRMLLNFGHTFGHAIEVDSHHKIKHGFAIATGMYLETLFGEKNGLLKSDVLEDISKILSIYEYDLHYTPEDVDNFISAIFSDKKARKDGLVLTLTESVGTGKIVKGVKGDLIRRFFEEIGSCKE